MILADTSVWIDHLRAGDDGLVRLLRKDRIVGHPLVTAEIALGSLRDRAGILALLDALPQAASATGAEIRTLIDRRPLHGRGIGYVDCALLAACLLTPGTTLWTRDRRVGAVAGTLGLAQDA